MPRLDRHSGFRRLAPSLDTIAALAIQPMICHFKKSWSSSQLGFHAGKVKGKNAYNFSCIPCTWESHNLPESTNARNAKQKTLVLNDENRSRTKRYWAIRSSARSFARTAHSFACSALLASLARSAALIRSLAHSLAPELMG